MISINGCKCNDDWEATLNVQPANRNILSVTGSHTCPAQGLKLALLPVKPQGIAPDEFMLDIKGQ